MKIILLTTKNTWYTQLDGIKCKIKLGSIYHLRWDKLENWVTAWMAVWQQSTPLWWELWQVSSIDSKSIWCPAICQMAYLQQTGSCCIEGTSLLCTTLNYFNSNISYLMIDLMNHWKGVHKLPCSWYAKKYLKTCDKLARDWAVFINIIHRLLWNVFLQLREKFHVLMFISVCFKVISIFWENNKP